MIRGLALTDGMEMEAIVVDMTPIADDVITYVQNAAVSISKEGARDCKSHHLGTGRTAPGPNRLILIRRRYWDCRTSKRFLL